MTGRWKKPGFTLIELTLVLALLVILTGLVVVRFDFGSPRQKAIKEARKIGRLIEKLREKAAVEETAYGLRFSLDSGQYEAFKMEGESGKGGEAPSHAARVFRLDPGIRFGKLRVGDLEARSPAAIILAPHGILARFSLEVVAQNGGGRIFVEPDPLIAETAYVER